MKDKKDSYWEKVLTRMQYLVTRKKGTERPFTGKYWNYTKLGVYRCICCGQELFSSGSKYDAGCGWPSFFEPLDRENLEEKTDKSHNMIRTEVLCSQCDAHLGHVFEDGPEPTGTRYCINSAALYFEKGAPEQEMEEREPMETNGIDDMEDFDDLFEEAEGISEEGDKDA